MPTKHLFDFTKAVNANYKFSHTFSLFLDCADILEGREDDWFEHESKTAQRLWQELKQFRTAKTREEAGEMLRDVFIMECPPKTEPE